MSNLATVLAINWSPELRGILIVIIAVTVLMGSVYMILGTNLGARLGFIVALTGLAGWMLLMGILWSMYGIGIEPYIGPIRIIAIERILDPDIAAMTRNLIHIPVHPVNGKRSIALIECMDVIDILAELMGGVSTR